jgi:hypothetical protein
VERSTTALRQRGAGVNQQPQVVHVVVGHGRDDDGDG